MQSAKRRYLVCVDGREECKLALRLACMKAMKNGGTVSMLHVIPPADFQTLGAIADKMREEKLEEGRKLLESMQQELKDCFAITPQATILEGAVGEKIVEAAMNDPDVIMIVVGVAAKANSSRGKLTSWLVGQLGGNLLVPVLLVPSNLTDEQLGNLI